MKRLCTYLVVGFAFFCATTFDVGAATIIKTKFLIYTKNTYAADYLSMAEKIGNNHYSGITWKTSNKSSHRMWFKIIKNSTDTTVGTKRLSFLATDTIKTNLIDGSGFYMLSAKREDSSDPWTTITGEWIP